MLASSYARPLDYLRYLLSRRTSEANCSAIYSLAYANSYLGKGKKVFNAGAFFWGSNPGVGCREGMLASSLITVELSMFPPLSLSRRTNGTNFDRLNSLTYTDSSLDTTATT